MASHLCFPFLPCSLHFFHPFSPCFFFLLRYRSHGEVLKKCVFRWPLCTFLKKNRTIKPCLHWVSLYLFFIWLPLPFLLHSLLVLRHPQGWKALTWYPVAGSQHRLALDKGQTQAWSWASSNAPGSGLEGGPGWSPHGLNGGLVLLKIFQTVKGE